MRWKVSRRWGNKTVCRRRPPDAGVGSTNPLRSSEPLVLLYLLPSDLDLLHRFRPLLLAIDSVFVLGYVLLRSGFCGACSCWMLMRGDDACMKVCQSPDVTKWWLLIHPDRLWSHQFHYTWLHLSEFWSVSFVRCLPAWETSDLIWWLCLFNQLNIQPVSLLWTRFDTYDWPNQRLENGYHDSDICSDLIFSLQLWCT